MQPKKKSAENFAIDNCASNIRRKLLEIDDGKFSCLNPDGGPDCV